MSLDGYNKFSLVDQAVHDAERRRQRRRIFIISVSSIVLVAIVVGAVFAAKKSNDDNGVAPTDASMAASIKAICNTAEDPDSCNGTLSSLSGEKSVSLGDLYRLSARLAMSELSNATLLFDKLKAGGSIDRFLAATADSCKELLGMAIERLNDTLADGVTPENVDDFVTWLSAALTYQDTCLEGFRNASAALMAEAEGYLRNSTEFGSNSLAIMTFLRDTFGSVGLRRRLLQTGPGDGFPAWLPAGDRRLLATADDPRAEAEIVVAVDGSGKYRSIAAALKAVPAKSKDRVVVYVKKGIYKENVVIEKEMTNVMLVGDGKNETLITGSLNVADGTPTFKTATLAVFGKGFIGRDFAVQNSAGAMKYQAVAMMSDSDYSVYYRMRFDGFQDTLYTHSMRQFYRECDVYGTVDFIFGNAAVVLQSCNILPRVPIPGQPCTLTAQGKTDKNMNTGTSIQGSLVVPSGNLTGVRVFLGRPWKNYSTTVYMKNDLPAVIDPAGWMEWIPGVEPPRTIFYAEYLNTGPGAGTAGRVRWKGIRTLDGTSAKKFTVDKFVGGKKWLPGTAIPYQGGL